MEDYTTMENIYNQLKSGMTSEQLVAEFTKSLNDAENRIKEEERAKVMRAEEARRLSTAARRESLIDALDTLISWFKEFYPELIDEADLDREAQGQLADVILLMVELKSLEAKRKPAPTEDAFAKFFKEFGL